MATNAAIERLYRVTVDGNAAISQLNKIADATKNTDKSLEAFNKQFSDLKRTLLGGITFAAVVAGFKGIVDSMSEIVDQSQKLGITTTAFQQLQFAAKQSGVSAEALNTGIKKLQIGLESLNDPTSEQGRLLKELGVRAGDDVPKAFSKIADAYSKSTEEGKKVNIIVKTLGKSANELIPILNNGSKGLKDFNDEMERLGLVVDEKTLQLFDQVGDNFDKIGAVAKSVGVQISGGMLPSLITIQEAISEASGKTNTFTKAGEVLGTLIRGLTVGFIYFSTVINQVGTGIGAVVAAAGELFSEGSFQERIARASSVINDFGKDFQSMSDAADAAVKKINDRAADLAKNGIPEATKAQKNLGIQTDKTAQELLKQAKVTATLRLEYAELVGHLTEVDKLNFKIRFGLVEYTRAQQKLAIAIALRKDEIELNKNLQKSYSELFKEQDKQTEAYEKLLEAIDPATKKTNAYSEGLEILTQRYQAGLISAEELDIRTKQLNDTYSGEIERLKALAAAYGDILKEQDKQIEDYNDLVQSLDPAIKKNEEYAKGLEIITREYQASRISAEEMDKQIEKLNKKFLESNPVLSIVEDNFKSFFDNLGRGTERAEELFKRMVQSIIAQLLRLAAQKAILAAFGINIGGATTSSAHGNVFEHGRLVRHFARGAAFEDGRIVQRFAKGTILTSPVLFPMSGGLGQAGEAGSEGVFPLARTSSGDLGVKGVSPTVNVNVINNTNSEVEVRQSEDGTRVDIIIDRAKRAVAADIRSGGGLVSSSIESTYALGRARGG